MVQQRTGETRIGQTIRQSAGKGIAYELLGICESIGVRANFGIGGAEHAWQAFLTAFLNFQQNRFLQGERIFLSGYYQFPEFPDLSPEKLREEVKLIDQQVAAHIERSIRQQRLPLIIGGGHNNAYGNIKGAAQALGRPVAVINFDAHADFRRLEGRHSGNGFTYAMEEGFLEKYIVFGLQPNYAPEKMLQRISDRPNIEIHVLNNLIRLSPDQFIQQVQQITEPVSQSPLGIEIDMDAVENVLSSACSPVGFSVQQLLNFIAVVKKHRHIAYIHIAEGTPHRADGTRSSRVGKLLAQVIANFLAPADY
ncbi:formimidoylglutamase [Niabella terrae]